MKQLMFTNDKLTIHDYDNIIHDYDNIIHDKWADEYTDL